MLSLLQPLTFQQPLVYDVPLSVSMCSQCSTPTYEWEHVVFGFLFLCSFAENDGFQLHPCPCKGHKLILFYGCIVFHCVYVPHFLYLIYHRWTFGLTLCLCYCEQYFSEHTCAFLVLDPWRVTTLFSTMVEWIYILTNSVEAFLFLCNHAIICCFSTFQ